jgi:hypothetical protein
MVISALLLSEMGMKPYSNISSYHCITKTALEMKE